MNFANGFARIDYRRQFLVTSPSQRRQFKGIEENAPATAQITDHQAWTIAIIVAFDFDCGKFAG